MKIAVLADIHGNLPALKAVLEEIENENINILLVAGDILGGPFPVEVIRILHDLNAKMIKGNYEDYLLKIFLNPSDSKWYKTKQWSPIYWVYKRLNHYWLEFINSLPKKKIISSPNKDEILMVHRIYKNMLPTDDSGVLVADKYKKILDDYTKSLDQSVLIYAHNHVQSIDKVNGCLALNPGSIGFPLNGTIGAQYMIMNWEKNEWIAKMRTVNYCIDDFHNAFIESSYLEEGGPIARLNLISILTGKAPVGEFFKFVYSLAREKGYSDMKNLKIIPDEILQLAEDEWDWHGFT
jgi:putative phosphoesterase